MPGYIERLLKKDAASGMLLMLSAAMAMFLANDLILGPFYFDLLDLPIQFRIAEFDIHKPLLLWVNDGLMAIFFLVIGLEVKEEICHGSLSSLQGAMLPIIAAVGGMVVPATIYVLFTLNSPEFLNGWAVPAATDIAFALGIMMLLGKRVPTSLKVFLLALAISDDLGAILIIALFYSGKISMAALGWSVVAMGALFILNRRRYSGLTPYLFFGLLLWTAVLKSGLHATLAGVVVGFFMPMNGREGDSPLAHMKQYLYPFSNFFILPVFAFVNAGVDLSGVSLSFLASPISLGIMLGLFLGKPLGIFCFSMLAVRLGIAELPQGANRTQLFATSSLCGIGFTMSIFISSLAFVEAATLSQSRLAILGGSFASALAGYYLLWHSTRERQQALIQAEVGASVK
ncbi:Na+/H+ antiporter NhaA [Aliagarivorans taiwanensis]|uniref:Na+/H+ antiporter NhaA n=1 Tax=Aliagarivorans taiwanensis TaxID=561966 RepID=UPI0004156238|nr:Na+/H+ antiporter NhaA [Aliagarivorans taiwanensis]